MKKTIVFCTLNLLLIIVCITSVAAQDRRSRFDTTVDSLVAQVDIQVQDRGKLIKVFNDLYEKLKEDELEKLDERIDLARLSAIQRESLVTADKMSLDPKGKARVGELVGFLDRVATRDQQLYDQYISSKESLRFEYERQLSKIKSEQTLLKSVRRDLEKLKSYPNSKEQSKFFLESVKILLDGLGQAHKL